MSQRQVRGPVFFPIRILTVALALILGSSSLALGLQQIDWEKAEQEIKRLPPAAFKQLPKKIVKELEKRGCTIPQAFYPHKRHNVIQGEFASKGLEDWAVLCSKSGLSSILIFWGTGNPCPSEVAPAKDISYLQDITGSGEPGYSRALFVVGADYIKQHYEWYGGPKPPPLDHQGINDAFVEKGSSVHYCYEGKWLELTGAD